MNRITGVLCFCLLLSIHSTAQIDQKVNFTHRVMYNYTFQPDSLDESLKISEDMILQVGKDHSNFMAYNQYLTDSIMAEMRTQAAADMAAGLVTISASIKGLENQTFEECLAKANIADLDGVKVPFLHINDLILNKKAVSRPKDQLDLIELEKIRTILQQSDQKKTS